ncbi:MAG: hypothetical protein NTX20_05530 [Verrucomicrobia bacterium]|nr:hypothetical protein [Verrucomicrobiota bacterium]
MNFDEAVRLIRAKDSRYQAQAYDLVRVGLDHAQKIVYGEAKKGKSLVNRHVTGPQLLEGFRLHVLTTYGPMSYPLLQNWGLKKSSDVGNIVFNIIETGMFGRSPEDNLADFEAVYDFKETFHKPFDSGNSN